MSPSVRLSTSVRAYLTRNPGGAYVAFFSAAPNRKARWNYPDGKLSNWNTFKNKDVLRLRTR
jgi:hypothetical protein